MEQYGFAGRDQLNVARDYINIQARGSSEFDEGIEAVGTSSGATFLYSVVIFVVVGALLMFATHSGIFAASTSINFPKTSSPWPAHSNGYLVFAPVGNWLKSCADEPLLAPEYCPQSAVSSAGNVSNVHWVIHGNPSDGTLIAYDDGKFSILGHAVMTVTYDSDAGSQWQLQIVGYQATVTWNHGHPTLISSGPASLTNGGPGVMKHDPNLPWSEVSTVVEAGFRHCAAYEVAPLPPQCPDIGNGGSSVRWRLLNDPLVVARESFDTSTGLVHVTGSFVLQESYSELFFGHQTYTWSGDYNASISLDGTTVTLLQIEEQ